VGRMEGSENPWLGFILKAEPTIEGRKTGSHGCAGLCVALIIDPVSLHRGHNRNLTPSATAGRAATKQRQLDAAYENTSLTGAHRGAWR
jgi:hypothetical protein